MSNPFIGGSGDLEFEGVTFHVHENGGWYSGLIDVTADGLTAIDYAEWDHVKRGRPRWNLGTEDGLRAFRLYLLLQVVPRREQLEVA